MSVFCDKYCNDNLILWFTVNAYFLDYFFLLDIGNYRAKEMAQY